MGEKVTIGAATLHHGDCIDILPTLEQVDACVTDPPYGVTSLSWDSQVQGWTDLLRLFDSGSLWIFGSLRSFMNLSDDMKGWRMAQDVIWEKHNGSGFQADRFKRVHEIVAQFYKTPWNDVYRSPVHTHDAVQRAVRRKRRPPHMGNIEAGAYESHDGGPRLMRSVIPVRSCHGHAQHPTQKPIGILSPLIEYSCPVGGVVLDPFMGSGSTGVACVDGGRWFIGIEKEQQYFDVACERLQAAQAQGRLAL